MSSDYLSMLRDCLETNINEDGNLITLLADRTGVNKVFQLQEENFDLFFKLAMPKVLAATLMEEDWYVDPDSGISIFEFERPSMSGPYKMLHLIMNVRSHNPPRTRRRPGQVSTHVQEAYRQVVRQIFSRQEFLVSEGIIDQGKLQESLDHIRARRRKYYPDEDLSDT